MEIRRLLRCVIPLVILINCAPALGQVPLPGAIDRYDTSLTLDQDVSVSVSEINAISVSGNVTLSFSTYTSGQSLDDAVDATTTYNVTVNGTSKKITGELDLAYASGISLSLLLQSPTGGTATEQTLSTTPADLVNAFGKLAQAGLSITYTASATINAAPNGSGESRTVTLTLTDN